PYLPISTLFPYTTLFRSDFNGRWYVFRVRPYRTEENKIEGAVMVLVDIDDIKRSAEKIHLITAHEEERRRISRELHDALNQRVADRKSTRLNSSHGSISY